MRLIAEYSSRCGSAPVKETKNDINGLRGISPRNVRKEGQMKGRREDRQKHGEDQIVPAPRAHLT